MLFPTSGQVYVRRTSKEAYNLECQVQTVKHGGTPVMIWAVMSQYSADPIITLHGWIRASDYRDILGNQVHSMVQMFSNKDAIFQEDNSPTHTNTQLEVYSLGFRSVKKHFIFPCQHNCQTYQTTVVSFLRVGREADSLLHFLSSN